jgi:hypothetical protein
VACRLAATIPMDAWMPQAALAWRDRHDSLTPFTGTILGAAAEHARLLAIARAPGSW